MNAIGQEILDLFGRGPIFMPGQLKDEGAFHFTSDFDEAIADFEAELTANDGDGEPWSNICRAEAEELYSQVYLLENSKSVFDQISADMDEIEPVIKKRFRFTQYEKIWDSVFTDMYSVVQMSYLPSYTSGPFQKIFDVYRAGGWLYGWSGKYPGGSMKVFVPEVAIDDTNQLLIKKRTQSQKPR